MHIGHITASMSASNINQMRLSAKPGSLYNNNLTCVLRVDVVYTMENFWQEVQMICSLIFIDLIEGAL